MDNQIPANRVEMEMSQWRNREDRLGKLFSFSLSSNRALAKEKLEYYDRIAARYNGSRDIDERFALRALAQERRQMEKQLYPNLLVRLLRRFIVMPFLQRLVIRRDTRQAEQNSQSLHEKVQRAGFTGLSSEIERQIKQGQQQFSIPVSYYHNERERMDHQLLFARDQTGAYHFNGYKSAVHNELKPGEDREQYFSMRKGALINTTEAYNLLAGRAIQKDGKWLQCDFNDKDQHGNYRFKEFQSGYGYDLDKILKQLPLKELSNPEQTGKLAETLKQGERQSVSFIKDGKEQQYYIEANPQFKSVNIFDEHSRKVSLNTAVGNKTTEAAKLANQVNERQNDSQSKRNAMRVMK